MVLWTDFKKRVWRLVVVFLDCLEKGCGDWVFWTDFLKGCRDLWIGLKKGCRDWFCGLP